MVYTRKPVVERPDINGINILTNKEGSNSDGYLLEVIKAQPGSRSDLYEESGMTYKEFNTALRKLQEQGLVQKDKRFNIYEVKEEA